MTAKSEALKIHVQATPRPRSFRVEATPRLLPERIELFNARRGLRARLIAANSRVATLQVDGSWDRLNTGARLTLDGKSGGLGPVQFHVQVIHDAPGRSPSQERLVQVRWVLLTAVEKRIYLVDVLRNVLGVDARVMTFTACGEDILGPHRKLLYEADKQRVRLINVGESVLPRSGEPVLASTPSVKDPDAPLSKRTQPGIVISTVHGDGVG